MPEAFRKLKSTRPLRLTIGDVPELGDSLSEQAACGGNVTIR